MHALILPYGVFPYRSHQPIILLPGELLSFSISHKLTFKRAFQSLEGNGGSGLTGSSGFSVFPDGASSEQALVPREKKNKEDNNNVIFFHKCHPFFLIE